MHKVYARARLNGIEALAREIVAAVEARPARLAIA
jgi:hypothetical protein